MTFAGVLPRCVHVATQLRLSRSQLTDRVQRMLKRLTDRPRLREAETAAAAARLLVAGSTAPRAGNG